MYPRPEVVISHVSRSWRNQAISNPNLWLTLIVSEEQPAPWVDAYLSRSRSLPISLRIDFGSHLESWEEGDAGPSQEYIQDVIDSVIPHMHRCRRLDIQLHNEYFILQILTRFQHLSAPFLESMNVTASTKSYPQITSDLPNTNIPKSIFLGGAPRLTYLRYDGRNRLWCHPPSAL